MTKLQTLLEHCPIQRKIQDRYITICVDKSTWKHLCLTFSIPKNIMHGFLNIAIWFLEIFIRIRSLASFCSVLFHRCNGMIILSFSWNDDDGNLFKIFVSLLKFWGTETVGNILHSSMTVRNNLTFNKKFCVTVVFLFCKYWFTGCFGNEFMKLRLSSQVLWHFQPFTS